MKKVDIKARIKEVRYMSDEFCVFVVETKEKKELICTVTSEFMQLVDNPKGEIKK